MRELKRPQSQSYVQTSCPLIFPLETYLRAVKQAGIDNAARPQIVLVILENQSKEVYAEVKYVSDVIVGVPSQCVVKVMQYITCYILYTLDTSGGT